MHVTFSTIFRRPVAHGLVRTRRRLAAQGGFTLIEALAAAVILVVGLIGLLGLLDDSVKASAKTRAREGAVGLAREVIEDARTIPYAQILPTSIESQLQAMNGLSNATPGSGWHINRRGFEYAVTVSECAIDDPKDGIAETHGSTFCEGQQKWESGKSVLDTQPEDLKRISVEVSWTFQKHTSTVKQVSTLTAAGQGIGLIATKLEITSAYNTKAPNSTATTPVITEASTKALTFTVSFQEGTKAVDWSLEGSKQEELTTASNATSTTFSWTINEPTKGIYVSDGTYQVSAQTVDSTGVIGPPISISVRLIRGVPAAPAGLIGGFNTVYKGGVATEVVEMQWKADSERNVIGYRVRGPSKELICPESAETLSTAVSCIDFDLLASKPSERAYTVAALYRDENEKIQEGTARSITIKRSESTAPNPPPTPPGLLAKKNADGSVTLKWKKTEGGTTPASFYRIYRGSKEYTSRYGTAECSTEECSFTDTDAVNKHEYWVTAVSEHLSESSFVGPVNE